MKKIFTLIAVALFGAGVAGAQSAEEQRKQSIEAQRQELMETRHQIRAGIGPMIGFSNPVYSLEYTYRVVEFLEVGGSLGYLPYVNEERPVGYYPPQEIINGYSIHGSIFARYSWFNRSWISFYSSLGLQGSYRNTTSQITQAANTSMNKMNYFGPEFVPFGVRVGGRLFGYIEPIGFSSRGYVLMLGVGFKF